MSAPLGNKYALGHTGGRPTLLTEELLEKAKGFLDYAKTQTIKRYFSTKTGIQSVDVPTPPTIVELAGYVGVSRETLYQWAKEKQDIADILSSVKEAYERHLVGLGLTDQYNAGLARFLLSADHGKREKTETDITSGGQPIFLPTDTIEKFKGEPK